MATKKVTNKQARQIRERRAKGALPGVLAAEFGMSKAAIDHLCLGQTYKDAGGPLYTAVPRSHIKFRADLRRAIKNSRIRYEPKIPRHFDMHGRYAKCISCGSGRYLTLGCGDCLRRYRLWRYEWEHGMIPQDTLPLVPV